MFDRQWVFNKTEHREYAGAPSFIDEIYHRRGIDPEKSDDISQLSDPFMLPDMDRAVERLLTAVEEGERIAVFGDYDADGVTASAALWHFIVNMLGADALCYIPDRISEGYGMSCSAVQKLAEQSVSLIITVDNGITAFKEAEYAASLGMDVVITDHHRCDDKVPHCAAAVDPCLLHDKAAPLRDLCGAGVAFALISATASQIGLGDEIYRYVPIVMIGTLGDAVPLTGDNRIIVKYGLKNIFRYGWTGIERLISDINGARQKAGPGGKEITASYITFNVVPKLNAAGRLGNAARAYELLISEDEETAARLSAELINENTKRQTMEAEITDKAVSPENMLTSENDSVAVSLGDGWHHGVIGIVAAKLTEKFGKPSVVLVKEENGLARGSARSVKGFDIYKALSGCPELMERFGGHEMAAGMTIKQENIPELIKRLNRFAAESRTYISEPPNTEIDAVILPEEITPETCEALSTLEPYGNGNPPPVLCVRGLRAESCSKVGDGGKHLKILFSARTSGGRSITLNGIAFSQGACENIVKSMDGPCSVICRPEINVWQGRTSVSLIISDIYDGDYNIDNGFECVYNRDYVTDAGFALERGTLAVMYKQLQSMGDSFRFSDLYIMRSDMHRAGTACTWYQIRNGLGVFTELGLIKRTDKQNYAILKPAGKADLMSSEIYRGTQIIR